MSDQNRKKNIDAGLLFQEIRNFLFTENQVEDKIIRESMQFMPGIVLMRHGDSECI